MARDKSWVKEIRGSSPGRDKRIVKRIDNENTKQWKQCVGAGRPPPTPQHHYPGRDPLPIIFHFRRFLLSTSGEEVGPEDHVITKLEKPSLDPVNTL